jgi:nitrate reductase (NAD(P)H)
MRNELDQLYTHHGNGRLVMHHTLSQAPELWEHGKGRITETTLAQHLPAPSPDGIVLMCGPDSLMHEVITPALVNLGWDTEHQVVIF